MNKRETLIFILSIYFPNDWILRGKCVPSTPYRTHRNIFGGHALFFQLERTLISVENGLNVAFNLNQ